MNVNYGDKIKCLREKKGLTQSDLADELGVVVSTISNYENSKRFPRPEMLQKLASYFDVSYEYFLTDSEPNTNKYIDLPHLFTDDSIELRINNKSLTPSEKLKLLQVLLNEYYSHISNSM